MRTPAEGAILGSFTGILLLVDLVPEFLAEAEANPGATGW